MSAQKAKEIYRGPDDLNCAQSVLKAFQDEFQITNGLIDEYGEYGKGQAEDGICGAAYAAMALAGDRREEVKAAFVGKAKYLTCKEIREFRSLPCTECVHLAASIVEGMEGELVISEKLG